MSIYHTHVSASNATQTFAQQTAAAAFATWPSRLFKWVATERQMQRSVGELSLLDDRILRDIGIDRSEITSAVRHGRR